MDRRTRRDQVRRRLGPAQEGLLLSPGKYQPSSEDCLTLNVLAPANAGNTPLPVMVFIHGGANTIGTSATGLYSGVSLVERGDIVYVSINYRLGALGYLDFTPFSTAERAFDSNLGLRDQVAALQWVQRNIAAFGGDPEKVTIFGESAGATAVTTLMATPAAKGLFAGAIAEFGSGSGLEHAAIARLGCAFRRDPQFRSTAREGFDLGDCRRIGPSRQQTRCRGTGEHAWTTSLRSGRRRRLPAALPLDAFNEGSAHQVPMIIGTNRREGTLFPKVLDALPTNPSRIDTMFALTDPEAGKRILATYPGYPDEQSAIDVGGDVTFWHPSVELMQAHAQSAPTYAYRFDFAPTMMRWLGLDATHGFEMFAVFGIGDTLVGRGLTLPGGRRGLRAVTESVQGHWLHFAKHGSPRGSWPRYDAQERRTMIFDEIVRVENDPRREQRLAWSGYSGYRSHGTDISLP